MSVRQAKAYFRRKKPIKRLPRDLVTRYDPSSLTENDIILMKASAAKDRHAVTRLMTRHGVTNAAHILPHLPKQKLTRFRTKLLNWLRRLEGSSEHDPLERELALMHEGETFAIRHGYLETKLKSERR